MLRLLKLVILVLVAFSFVGFFWNQEEKSLKEDLVIQADTDKDQIETGEVFVYTLLIEGELEGKPEIKEPLFGDFEIVSTQTSRTFSYRQGKTIISLKLTYSLVAPEPGLFTIEPPEVTAAGKTYQGEAIQIKVKGEPLADKEKLQPYIEQGIEI